MIAENDPAGTAIQLSKAINQYTEHQCRLITWETRYVCNFEKDIHLEDNPDWNLVESLLKHADVFHFHMLANENTQLGPYLVKNYIEEKKIIRHHHGHYKFRENLKSYQDLYSILDDPVFVSTPDMIKLFYPGRSEWLPNLINYNDPKYAPKTKWDNSSMLRIVQSPTRKQIKSTDCLSQVVHRLQEEGYWIDLDIIEMKSHKEVLQRKRTADIVFDQMNYSFGISSLESFALGVPVICKFDKEQLNLICKFTGCKKSNLPWYDVQNEEELYQVLKNLAQNKSPLKQLGVLARKFMEKHWQIEKILSIYTKCLSKFSSSKI